MRKYSDYLAHFGVKGMHWGRRKDRDDDSELIKLEKKYKHIGAYGGKAIRNPDGGIYIGYKTYEDHLRDKKRQRRQRKARSRFDADQYMLQRRMERELETSQQRALSKKQKSEIMRKSIEETRKRHKNKYGKDPYQGERFISKHRDFVGGE